MGPEEEQRSASHCPSRSGPHQRHNLPNQEQASSLPGQNPTYTAHHVNPPIIALCVDSLKRKANEALKCCPIEIGPLLESEI